MKQLYQLVNREDWIRTAFEKIDDFILKHLYYHPYQPLSKTAEHVFISQLKK